MKKLTQKLVLSVLTMALVVVALGTSTFAWFSLTNSAKVGQFNAQVTAGEGIEVSLGTWASSDATITPTSTWYTAIPNAVIQQRLVDMYASSLKLVDLTSADGIVIQDKANAGQSALGGGYVQFKLFFRSTATKTITWTSATLSGTAADWTVDVPFVAANNDAFVGGTLLATQSTLKVGAWAAARVSIFNEAGNMGNRYQQAQKLETDVVNLVSNSTALPAVSYDTGKEFGAAAYQLAKNAGVSSYTLPSTTHGVALTEITAVAPVPVVALVKAIPATDLYAFGTVVVRVWIEGWDADTYDAIFSTHLFVDLGFGVAA